MESQHKLSATRSDGDSGNLYDEKDLVVDQHIDYTPVGREALHSKLPPHDDYDGVHRWDPDFVWTPEEEKRVVRKADLRLLSIICVMFLGLQLDRGNLSNALADNLLKDLHLTTNDYNNGTTIQVLAFLLCEFPSQLMVARFGFKRWLPFLMFAWGIVSCLQAFMHERVGFFVTRALIGAFEGGFIPGAVTLCSYWYKSKEMAIRLSFFWTTLNIARVISALLAAGILTMRGVGGRTGWFWLFIIEGGWTCLVAVIAFFWLPWSPVRTTGGIWRKPWFTEREEKIMINRVLRDDPAKGLSPNQMKIKWGDIRTAWSDMHLWMLVFVGLVAYIPQNPVQAYFTLSLKTLGYSTLRSNMLSITPAMLQIFLMLGISYSSDYFNERSFHCLFGELWSLPCLIAMRLLPDGGHVWARFALTTLVSGYPYFHPIITAWISENSFSVKRRYVQITTYNVVVQMGAVVASQIYRADDAPYYHRGNVVLISICVLASLAMLATWAYIGYENKKKERIWASMSAEEKTAYQEDLAAREPEGPKRLDFRVTR